MVDNVRESTGARSEVTLEDAKYNASTETRDKLYDLEIAFQAIQEPHVNFGLAKWSAQKKRVIIAIEKDAILGAVKSVTKMQDVEIFPLRGYSSTTFMKQLADRIRSLHQIGAGTDPRCGEVQLLIITDYDPSGEDIARDVQERLRYKFGVTCTAEKILLTKAQIKNTGALKIATGEDRGFAEKKFKDGFTFINYAKLSFSCNQLPKTPDETRAFYKRAIYLNFDTIIPLEEQDDTLKEKLTTPEELSGILNWALEGLRRAQERHRLDEPTTIEERRTGYRRLSDPVASFAEDRLIEDVEAWEIKADVYRAFARYCMDMGFTTPSDASFFKDLKKHMYYHGGQKTINKQKGVRVLLGVKLLGDTQGKHPTQGVIPMGVVVVESKIVDPVYPVHPVYPLQDQLFKDAREILEANGDTMEQVLLFKGLVGVGYNQAQAGPLLRADPRLSFRGMDVSYIGAHNCGVGDG